MEKRHAKALSLGSQKSLDIFWKPFFAKTTIFFVFLILFIIPFCDVLIDLIEINFLVGTLHHLIFNFFVNKRDNEEERFNLHYEIHIFLYFSGPIILYIWFALSFIDYIWNILY